MSKRFSGNVPASMRDFVGPWVGPSVGFRKTLIVLIGFQTANKNHLKSHEVAVRVTMLCKPIGTGTVQVYTHHGVRSESTSNITRLQLKSIQIGTVQYECTLYLSPQSY